MARDLSEASLFNPQEGNMREPQGPIVQWHPHVYLVIITAPDGRPRKITWDSSVPLPLNHPTTWQLEDHPSGIVIRSVAAAESDGEPIRVTETAILNGTPVVVGKLKVQVRKLKKAQAGFLPPASFAVTATTAFVSTGCAEAFLAFRPLERSHIGYVNGKRAVHIIRTAAGLQIEGVIPGLTVSTASDGSETTVQRLLPGIPRTFFSREAATIVIRFTRHWWRIALVSPPASQGLEKAPLIDNNDQETIVFTRILKTITAGVIALAVATWLNFVPTPAPIAKQEQVQPTLIQLKRPMKKPEVVKRKEEPKPIAIKKKEPEKKKIAIAKPNKVKKKLAQRLMTKKPLFKPAPAPAPKLAAKPAPKKTLPAPAPKSKMIAQRPVAPPRPTTAQLQAAARAAEQAATRNKLSKTLGFLSTGSKGISARTAVAVSERNAYTKYQNISASSKVMTQSGNSYLSTVANKVGGNGLSAINTKNSRNISSDAGVAGSFGAGGKGKSLNEVQGRVSLAALYDANAGDGIGSALGGQSTLALSGEGTISEGALMKILEKYMQKFQYCYEKALLAQTTLAGSLLMQWTIQSGGHASNIKVVRSQLNHAGLHSCMATELARISFPNPHGGSVVVKFPFAFTSSVL